MTTQLPAKALVASFDVDAQNTFTPVCPDELPVAGGADIVPELNAQARFASFRVGSKDAHSPSAKWVATAEKPQFSPIEAAGPNVDIHWNLHGVPGTLGFELIDGLPRPADYDYFVWKGVEPDMHPYGACFHDLAGRQSTGVIEVLKSRGIETVIVGGLATDFCVKLTVLQLVAAGFKVIVNLAACRGIAEDSITAAKVAMEICGAILITSAADLSQE